MHMCIVLYLVIAGIAVAELLSHIEETRYYSTLLDWNGLE